MFQKFLKQLKETYLKKSVWLESLIVLVVISMLFMGTMLLHETNIFKISKILQMYILRNLIRLYLIIVVLNGIMPFKRNIKLSLFSGIIPLIWMVVYSYTFFSLHNLKSYIFYYSASTLLFCAFYAVNIFLISGNSIQYKVLKFGCIIVDLFLSLPPIIYLAYFKIYKTAFDDYAMLAVLGTNITEAREYLVTQVPQSDLFCLFFLVVLLLVLLGFIFHFSLGSFDSFKLILLIVTVLFIGTILIRHRTEMFPLDKLERLQAGNGAPLQIVENLKNNLKSNVDSIVIKKNEEKDEAKTVILVIGESANRDYMSSFNNNKKEDTTPWERKMRNSPDFVFFENSYANFQMTVMALSQALTNVNQYNKAEFEKAISIVDIAKKAGYRTYWLSMQESRSIYEMGTSVIANQSDQIKWCKGYDEKVISQLNAINPDKNNFIVIHLYGSHYQYKDRYPKLFANKNLKKIKKPYEDYKLSLLYTDEILKQIYEYANKNLNLSVMMYFSDHGEDMKYKHVNNPFYWSMARVPVWIYLSPSYVNNYPESIENLRKHRKKVFTNDLIFDTMHGLLQVRSNYYSPEFDLSNLKYRLTLESAKTMWGKRKVSDDPAWKNK